VAPGFGKGDLAPPAVIVEKAHRGLDPIRACATSARQDRGGDHIVSVAEDVHFDGEGLADNGLGAEAAAIDLGAYLFDGYAIGGERSDGIKRLHRAGAVLLLRRPAPCRSRHPVYLHAPAPATRKGVVRNLFEILQGVTLSPAYKTT